MPQLISWIEQHPTLPNGDVLPTSKLNQLNKGTLLNFVNCNTTWVFKIMILVAGLIKEALQLAMLPTAAEVDTLVQSVRIDHVPLTGMC